VFSFLRLLGCGLGDTRQPDPDCDRQADGAAHTAMTVGAITVIALTVLVALRPDTKPLRFVVWAVPAAMFVYVRWIL
jgi:hypothetical protein